MLRVKDLITRWDWSHADGPMRVWVYGRYTHGELIIHGLVVQNTYRKNTSWKSHLPPAKVVLPMVVAQLKKELLNGDTIRITTPNGLPAIAVWGGLMKRFEPDHCFRGYRGNGPFEDGPRAARILGRGILPA